MSLLNKFKVSCCLSGGIQTWTRPKDFQNLTRDAVPDLLGTRGIHTGIDEDFGAPAGYALGGLTPEVCDARSCLKRGRHVREWVLGSYRTSSTCCQVSVNEQTPISLTNHLVSENVCDEDIFFESR